MKKRILITIGIPSSGKSKYADNLEKQVDPNKLVRLNADSIRIELLGRVDCFDNEALVWGTLYNRYDDALLNDEITHIIIDNTHVSFKSRKEYYKLLNYHSMRHNIDDVHIHLVYINTNVEKSLELQEGRERKVPREVLERMQNTLDSNGVFSEYEKKNFDCKIICVDPESSCGFSDVV